MAPTNIKMVHQTSLLHIESSLDGLGLLSPTHDQRSQQQSGQITLQPVLINKSKFRKATHGIEIRKIEIPRSMVVKRASIQPSKALCILAKAPRILPVRRSLWKKNDDRGQTSAFPSETSRFAPLILAHRGSVLPWLVDDRAALRLRRIWCVPTR